jgi:signal transduction histidine kinase
MFPMNRAAPVLPLSTTRRASFHPLELIPIFRRWPCGPWRDLVYTFIWNCLLGTGFYVVGAMFNGQFGALKLYWIYLAISNFIGFAIHFLFALGERTGLEPWVRARGFLTRVVYFSGVPTLGVIVGFQISSEIFGLGFSNWIHNPGWIVSVATTSVIISIILSTIIFSREKEARAQTELAGERLRVERIERESALANLRALQAQIEPHFLFNTLANVTSLVDSDPAKAKHMLESFIRFLRSSLAATRLESTTLGEEAELIAAFLDVLKVRMGARLRYSVEVAPELTAFEIAPMLLQPVVENAIRHGLEPKVDGGEVAMRVRRVGDDVVIGIADTGVGFASTTRGGVGLTNLRDRLKLIYGERASLTVGENPGGGALVTVRIPA